MWGKGIDHLSESDYSGVVRRHRLNKGGILFKRTRYQQGSVEREERKKGPAVWVYRWWEEDINGKLVHRKAQVGDVKKYPTESAAHAAADALGALLSRGTASQSIIHAGRVHNVREKLDCPTLGQSATGTSQNCGGRAL